MKNKAKRIVAGLLLAVLGIGAFLPNLQTAFAEDSEAATGSGKHQVLIDEMEHGEAFVARDYVKKDGYETGEKIKFRVCPYNGYEIESWQLKSVSGKELQYELEEEFTIVSFRMPDEDVSISASFKESEEGYIDHSDPEYRRHLAMEDKERKLKLQNEESNTKAKSEKEKNEEADTKIKSEKENLSSKLYSTRSTSKGLPTSNITTKKVETIKYGIRIVDYNTEPATQLAKWGESILGPTNGDRLFCAHPRMGFAEGVTLEYQSDPTIYAPMDTWKKVALVNYYIDNLMPRGDRIDKNFAYMLKQTSTWFFLNEYKEFYNLGVLFDPADKYYDMDGINDFFWYRDRAIYDGGPWAVNHLNDYDVKVYYYSNGVNQPLVGFEVAEKPKTGYIKIQKYFGSLPKNTTNEITYLNSNKKNYAYYTSDTKKWAKYTLYTDPQCTSVAYDADGKKAEFWIGTNITRDVLMESAVKEMEPRDYWLKEDGGAMGYGTAKAISGPWTVVAGTTPTTATVATGKDSVKSGTIEIQKVSKKPEMTENNEMYSMEGAVYTVYSNEDCTIKVCDITIDETGFGHATGLSFGEYWVKETKPGKNYTVDPYPQHVILKD